MYRNRSASNSYQSTKARTCTGAQSGRSRPPKCDLQYNLPLLRKIALRSIGGDGRGRAFWSTQIAPRFLLVHGPDHHRKQQMIPSRIELNRLGGIAILLLDGLVVGGHIHRELAAFGIGFLKL